MGKGRAVHLHGDGEVARVRDDDPDESSRADTALAEALARAKLGDQQAVAIVYRMLNPRLLRYLHHHVGELAPDLASEVWLALAHELQDQEYDGNPSSARALMFTIAHRRVADHYRRARRQVKTVPMDEAEGCAAAQDPAQLAVDGIEAQRAVQMLAAELPPDQAEIVLLRVLGDLDVAQVAAIVGKTPGAVRVAQHRAVRTLQRRWQRSSVTP
jgi:RNA polymerase sigma-70 factor, ECF subfamily